MTEQEEAKKSIDQKDAPKKPEEKIDDKDDIEKLEEVLLDEKKC